MDLSFSIIQGFHPVWSKEEPFVFDLANPDVALIRFAVQVKKNEIAMMKSLLLLLLPVVDFDA